MNQAPRNHRWGRMAPCHCTPRLLSSSGQGLLLYSLYRVVGRGTTVGTSTGAHSWYCPISLALPATIPAVFPG
ncbi:predicted protein [Plenodomus lingam JN3]|uniref:Predicted protein n=1 Tax=Leptosphaeria maculans (strain JN3 / isolate v23.1.3 / race Av1-4-5-6-7-8) TaxID=985895 RepID=E4ZZN8_LEPMJ|nr:predicted protein [Plenodomus lingam JN3]CBX97154.1 predicted protein [Plenodomus lingam JN3]